MLENTAGFADPGSASKIVEITGTLSISDSIAVAEGRAVPVLSSDASERIVAAHGRLRTCVRQARLVYGVTTGFGPLANRQVGTHDIQLLQRNLIYHLATGVGDVADWVTARMIVVARLSSIAQGVSGASPELVARLLGLLGSPYAPRIPMKGTVGASGDLTPLAHMALALLGEGNFIDRDGSEVSSEKVLGTIGGPFSLESRDGLALVNGTSVMTALAVLDVRRAERLIEMAERLTVGMAEILNGRAEAWHDAFARHRPHPGQVETAKRLRLFAKGSAMLVEALAAETLLNPALAAQVVERPLQDAYTLRCAPQVIGAARDMLATHLETTQRELNSATDNPLFPEDAPALHGGNFMGQHIGFASDLLSNATLTLAAFAERQIARLTDERLNEGLPAFLHQGSCGLNSGLMGAQVTATAILAEMRSRSVPASMLSISTNGANQDHVSMGTIAARNARDHLKDFSMVLSILGLAVAQGIDCRGQSNRFASATLDLYRFVRDHSETLTEDRPLSPDILRLADAILNTDPF
ncbi:MAG: histidine ammonia-lyase [Paracoccaceae bacterium]|mgnify:CR=1 FL=1